MTIIQNWQAPIAEMYLEKQHLATVDPQGIFPFHLPNTAASEESIINAETSIGVSLDQEYRSFLQYADGWNCFYQNVSLFGTADLVGGSLREAASETFEYTPEILESLDLTKDELLPIAASLEQADVFVMIKKSGHVGPQVVWLAEGEIIDTFETFAEYYMSMVEYTKRRAEKLKNAEQ